MKGDHYVGPRILQHEANALVRVGMFQRHVGSTCFENAQQADHHFHGPLKTDADDYLWTNPTESQITSQLIGAGVEHSVGYVLLSKNQRHTVWRFLNLLLKQVRETSILRVRCLCPVELN